LTEYPEEPQEATALPPLPLEHLRIECACGKEDCHAVAGFGVANGRLKIR